MGRPIVVVRLRRPTVLREVLARAGTSILREGRPGTWAEVRYRTPSGRRRTAFLRMLGDGTWWLGGVR